QQWWRHREDCEIAHLLEAVCAPDQNILTALFDRGHGGAELDCGALSAAFLREKTDEGAVAAGDARLRPRSAMHPFVPHRKDAGLLRVSRVIALDHALDGMP